MDILLLGWLSASGFSGVIAGFFVGYWLGRHHKLLGPGGVEALEADYDN